MELLFCKMPVKKDLLLFWFWLVTPFTMTKGFSAYSACNSAGRQSGHRPQPQVKLSSLLQWSCKNPQFFPLLFSHMALRSVCIACGTWPWEALLCWLMLSTIMTVLLLVGFTLPCHIFMHTNCICYNLTSLFKYHVVRTRPWTAWHNEQRGI